MPRSARILLALVSLALSAGAAEFAFRALARADYERRVAAWPGEPLIAIAPGAPWYFENKKDCTWEQVLAHGAAEVRIVHHTDADGWRVQPPVPRMAPTQTIACVGDSYMFGYAVGDAETLPCCLQGILRRDGFDVAVTNRGVPGYNSELELARLRDFFPRERPDVVLLGYVMNDAEAIPHVPLPPQVLYEHCGSWLADACVPAINSLGRLLVTDHPLAHRRMLDLRADYAASFAYDNPAWRRSFAALLAMRDLVHAAGSQFAVLVLPDFTQPFDDGYGWTLVHERLAQWGRETGTRIRDVLPHFAGDDHARLWVPGDGHPGAEAQARMAVQAALLVIPLLR